MKKDVTEKKKWKKTVAIVATNIIANGYQLQRRQNWKFLKITFLLLVLPSGKANAAARELAPVKTPISKTFWWIVGIYMVAKIWYLQGL